MDKISFKSGQYALRRGDCAVGDEGTVLVSLDPQTGEMIGENGDVIIGCGIQCGSAYARSYQSQDWWMTSIVKEILEVHDGYAVIQTKNNKYYVGDARAVKEAIINI